MYAYSKKFYSLKGAFKGSFDKFDTIKNLTANLFSKCLSDVIRKGLCRDYTLYQEDLSTVKGTINIPGSIKCKIKHTSKLNCEFDEYAEDNAYNRILKSTAFHILTWPRDQLDPSVRKKIKSQSVYFSKIQTICLNNIRWDNIRFSGNNRRYQPILNLCKFINEELIQNTGSGSFINSLFENENKMEILFERFLREYYKYHYPSIFVKSRLIDWHLGSGLGHIPNLYCDMQFDDGKKNLILDAKYYSEPLKVHYNRKIVDPHNIHQLYTYVSRKAVEGKPVSGLLVYARPWGVDLPFESYPFNNNSIDVTSVDLSQPFEFIAHNLDTIIEHYYGIQPKKHSA